MVIIVAIGIVAFSLWACLIIFVSVVGHIDGKSDGTGVASFTAYGPPPFNLGTATAYDIFYLHQRKRAIKRRKKPAKPSDRDKMKARIAKYAERHNVRTGDDL